MRATQPANQQASKQASTQTERQTVRQADRQTVSQAGGQTNTKTKEITHAQPRKQLNKQKTAQTKRTSKQPAKQIYIYIYKQERATTKHSNSTLPQPQGLELSMQHIIVGVLCGLAVGLWRAHSSLTILAFNPPKGKTKESWFGMGRSPTWRLPCWFPLEARKGCVQTNTNTHM